MWEPACQTFWETIEKVRYNCSRAYHPFWSYDGKWIGYSTDRAIRVVSAEGGSSRTLVSVSNPVHPDWNQNDQIIYIQSDTIYVVDATGGQPAAVVETPAHSSGE